MALQLLLQNQLVAARPCRCHRKLHLDHFWWGLGCTVKGNLVPLDSSDQFSLPGTLSEDVDQLSLPASSGGAFSVQKTQVFGSSLSFQSTLAPSSLAVKRRLHGKQTVWSFVPTNPSSHGSKAPTWKCPMCGFKTLPNLALSVLLKSGMAVLFTLKFPSMPW